MCGIVGYIGNSNATNIVFEGLKLLEYRGYDSAGISTVTDGKVVTLKKAGKVSNLQPLLAKLTSRVAIGHTRWATHGEPSDKNAHPHSSTSGDLVMVHNGIIENHRELRAELQREGVTIKSETDSEVLIAYIEFIARKYQLTTIEACRQVLPSIHGSYALTILDKSNPDSLIVARNGGPLVVGVGQEESMIASDASPIVGRINKVVYLSDGHMAEIVAGKLPHIIDLTSGRIKKASLVRIPDSLADVQKGDFKHFMIKEIYDQPAAIADCLRGRLKNDSDAIKLGGIEKYEKRILSSGQLQIVGCGTSWHAGLIAKYYFEKLAGIRTAVDIASEYRYRSPLISSKESLLAISQSGETADTLAAIELAKMYGALTLGLCNVVGSSIARETEAGVFMHAGPEISVASTKAFTAQVATLLLMAARLAKVQSGQLEELNTITNDLANVPKLIKKQLENTSDIKKIAESLKDSHLIMFMGRGVSYPVALEAALKMKEISYIHAEGFAAGELKHGSIALIEKNTPVVVIAPSGEHYEKTLSNAAEVQARGARVILVSDVPNDNYETIIIPKSDELVSPLLSVVAMQLLAYYTADAKGLPIDQPRNLAKSVTVE